MKTYLNHLLLLLSVLAFSACQTSPTIPSEIIVSPNAKPEVKVGSGEAVTLATVKTYIRQLNKSELPENGLTVLLQEGVYSLDEALTFDSLDGGVENKPVVYKAQANAKVIWSGGKEINNWEQQEGNLWKTTMPEVASGTWYFRQLFTDEQRLTRAKSPNDGWYVATNTMEEYKDLIGHWDFAKMIEVRRDEPKAICGFGIREGDLKNWEDMNQAEVLWLNSWDASWHSIQQIDSEKNEVLFNSPANWTAGFYSGKMPRYRVENVREALDQAGEWYLNKATGELFYIAKEGENPNEMTFYAPEQEELLLVGNNAKYLKFEGITFSHTKYQLGAYAHTVHQEDIKPPYTSLLWDWPNHAKNIYLDWPTDFMPGFTDPQAAVHAGFSIILENTENITFDNCTFDKLGSNAIQLAKKANYNKIINSHFVDLGTGGIHIGLPITDYKIAGLTEEETPAFNLVKNNLIEDGSIVNPGGVAIWMAQTHDNKVLHNEIRRHPYIGISVGWTWGGKENFAKNNLFEANEIYDVMELLADGGAFYSLGILEGNVYRRNYIHDVAHSEGAIGAHNNGIFFDEGSAGILVEENVIHNTAHEVIRFNASHDSSFVFRNNYFDTDSLQVKANYDYNTSDMAKGRFVKIKISDNYFGVKPNTENFPKEIAENAGLLK